MKKNLKSLFSLILAVSMCAVISGCGESADNGSQSGNRTPERPAAQDSAGFESSQADAYAYYDLLAKEWENSTIITRVDLNTIVGSESAPPIAIQEGSNLRYWSNYRLGFYVPSKKYGTYSDSYSATKERSMILYFYSKGNDYCEYNVTSDGEIIKFRDGGTVYSADDYDNVNSYFPVYDSDGNSLVKRSGVGEFYEGKFFKFYKEDNIVLLENGELAFGRDYGLFVMSADYSYATWFSSPEKETAHGFTEPIELDFLVGTYSQKLYAVCTDEDIRSLWSFDLNSYEWEYLAVIPQYDWYEMEYDANIPCYGKVIGRYWIYDTETSSCIIDLTTGEVIAFPQQRGFYAGYFGGTQSVFQYQGDWVVGRIADGNGDPDIAFVMPDTEGETGGEIVIPFSDTQYIYIDGYGVFLRSLADGEEGEETIYLS